MLMLMPLTMTSTIRSPFLVSRTRQPTRFGGLASTVESSLRTSESRSLMVRALVMRSFTPPRSRNRLA